MIGLTNDNWADNEIQAFKLLFVQKMQKKLFFLSHEYEVLLLFSLLYHMILNIFRVWSDKITYFKPCDIYWHFMDETINL